jgi:hypothetical protein
MDKNLVFNFTEKEVHVILGGLGKLPAEVSYDLITKVKLGAYKQLESQPKEEVVEKEG